MARLPRLSVAGVPHLLVQRSHPTRAAFVDDSDRTLFRNLLGEIARAEGVALHAYALHDHEVRMLATPATAEALGRLMQSLGRRYGGAFNRRHQRTGSLWEGRFRATVLEAEQHLLDAMAFVEDDPLGEGGPFDDMGPVSSRGHHVGRRQDSLVTDHPVFWSLGNTPFEREAAYRLRLAGGLPASVKAAMQAAVLKGWPLGTAAFITRLSNQTTRRLVPLKRGRPRKLSPPKPDPN